MMYIYFSMKSFEKSGKMEDFRNDYRNEYVSAGKSDAEVEAEVRQRIAERKRARRRAKMRRRRIVSACIAIIITAFAGWGAGKFAGNSIYEMSLKEPVSVVGDMPIIREAMSQVGNVNGQPFWSWYGFEERVDWCACFASWVEDKCGYIESGAAPKFAMVGDGSSWFLERDQWKYGGETPDAGDLIFFNWDGSGSQDHVGVVTAVIGNNVYTVEGNSSNRCRQKRYNLEDPVIYGYGHINP